jgi:hypothetical protein
VKRASYREGIECIALNDEPTSLEVEDMEAMASVMLQAVLFGVTQERVAKDVVRFRKKLAKAEARLSKLHKIPTPVVSGPWVLVHAVGKAPVFVGEQVASRAGFPDTVLGGTPPQHPASTGRVAVKHAGEFFPSVFGMTWVRRGEGTSHG